MQKQYRIKKNEEIADIVTSHKRVTNKYFFTYYQPSNDSFKIAISVSKKYGNAVERNHAKRIVREIVRPNVLNYPNIRLVVVVRPEFKEATFIELRELMDTTLVIVSRKLKSRVDGNKNNRKEDIK
jgi:ribonuclease P protein component